LKTASPKDGALAKQAMIGLFQRACDDTRKNKIRVITIGYTLQPAYADYLRNCASSDSDFHAGVDTTEIEALYRDIAKEINDAREQFRLVY
jgi:hypothetical protein